MREAGSHETLFHPMTFARQHRYCTRISTEIILKQENTVHELLQRQARWDLFVILSYFHFIPGQTNFMVGSLQPK